MKRKMAERRDFEAQALPHLEGLYRAALHLLGSESDAQDLTQECFVEAYRSWHERQTSANCRVWLFAIMANALVNKCRPCPNVSNSMNGNDEIDTHIAPSLMVAQEPADNPGQIPFSTMSGEDVKKAIGDLPQEFRLPVVLSLLEGFSSREIADIAGVSPQTVISRLNQGRRLIREYLSMLWRAKATAGYPQIQSGAEE